MVVPKNVETLFEWARPDLWSKAPAIPSLGSRKQ